MEMDHWCTFANNVIGRGNRRPFVLFVAFVWLSSGYGAVMGLRHASVLPALTRCTAERSEGLDCTPEIRPRYRRGRAEIPPRYH